MVTHTPAPKLVQEVRKLLVERAELIRRSPGVVASALYEQFLPPHGLTAFATLSLISDLGNRR